MATSRSGEVEDILDSKVVKQRGRVCRNQSRSQWVEYLVKWKGYEGEDTWERSDQLFAPEAVQSFHQRYPRKSTPHGLVLQSSALSPSDRALETQLPAVSGAPVQSPVLQYLATITTTAPPKHSAASTSTTKHDLDVPPYGP